MGDLRHPDSHRTLAGVVAHTAPGDDMPLSWRQPIVRRDGQPSPGPCFAAPPCFLFKVSFGTFFRTNFRTLQEILGFLRQVQLRFSSPKLHQGEIRQLEQDYLGLHFEFKHLDFTFIDPSRISFSFPSLSLLFACSYFSCSILLI